MTYREPDRGIEGNRLAPGPTGVINSNLILIANHGDGIRSKFVERSISTQSQYGLPTNIQNAKQVLSIQIDVGQETQILTIRAWRRSRAKINPYALLV